MNCGDFKRYVSRALDRELGRAESRALTEHLALCSECRTLNAQMTSMDEKLKNAPVVQPPEGLASRIIARRAAPAHEEGLWVFLPTWGRVSVAAVVIILGIGIGNLAGRSLSSTLAPEKSEVTLDLVMPDSGQSLADVAWEVGEEENGR